MKTRLSAAFAQAAARLESWPTLKRKCDREGKVVRRGGWCWVAELGGGSKTGGGDRDGTKRVHGGRKE